MYGDISVIWVWLSAQLNTTKKPCRHGEFCDGLRVTTSLVGDTGSLDNRRLFWSQISVWCFNIGVTTLSVSVYEEAAGKEAMTLWVYSSATSPHDTLHTWPCTARSSVPSAQSFTYLNLVFSESTDNVIHRHVTQFSPAPTAVCSQGGCSSPEKASTVSQETK